MQAPNMARLVHGSQLPEDSLPARPGSPRAPCVSNCRDDSRRDFAMMRCIAAAIVFIFASCAPGTTISTNPGPTFYLTTGEFIAQDSEKSVALFDQRGVP